MNWIKEKWTKFKKWLLVLFGVSVALAAGTQLQPTDKISQTAIKDKFAISALSSKYVSEGSSFRQAVKPDWKEKTEVRIGNETSADFEPTFELRKWDEVRVKLTPKLGAVAKKDKDVTFEGDKMKFKTQKEEIHFYDLPDSTTTPEGGYEIEWILNEKPATNKVEFDIETDGLDFFYQPPLTQAEIDEGLSRPENVEGSYAVYASEQKINWTGGKLYKTGKVGHIFRPKIIDSSGTNVWGDLHIENGILSVNIPQSFLDKAQYPVRHAAGLTFGFEGVGGTAGAITNKTFGDIRVGDSLQIIHITSGSGNWTIPAGVTSVVAESIGGGGAGGGRSSIGQAGGGGGGAYARKTFTGLTPGNTIAYSVGAAIAGGTGDGSAGNDTWFSSNDASGCVADGGAGGASAGGAGAGGTLANSYGDQEYVGGNGSAAGANSGAGGGGAGSTGNGNNAVTTTGGAAKLELGDAGGNGRTTTSNGGAGLQAGGGGGGAKRTTSGSSNGGTGAAGVIRITWATGASGTLANIMAYLGGSAADHVKTFLYKLHGSGTYGSHSQIAKIENASNAAAAGWKTFTAASEALTATDTYIIAAIGSDDDLAAGETYNMYGDYTGLAGKFSSDYNTAHYAADPNPWAPVTVVFSAAYLRNSIYATYTASGGGSPAPTPPMLIID